MSLNPICLWKIQIQNKCPPSLVLEFFLFRSRKNWSLLCRAFRRSGSIFDFLKYRNACSHTTYLLKCEKQKNLESFRSNLNPSYSLKNLWTTVKRFKNCVNTTLHLDNDDWFDDFSSKVTPCYIIFDSEFNHFIFFSESTSSCPY